MAPTLYPAAAAPIDRRSSIETEPPTLDNLSIKYAREAALCVINTKSFEEAMHIFTRGLEPVTSARKKYEDDAMSMALHEEELKCPVNIGFSIDAVTAPF